MPLPKFRRLGDTGPIIISHKEISVVSKFLILHTQCSKEVKQMLLNSMILAQKGYLSPVNYVGKLDSVYKVVG